MAEKKEEEERKLDMPKLLDKARVVTKDNEYIGKVLPNEYSDSLVLKLKSGYNIGISKKKIREIEILEEYDGKKEVGKKNADVEVNPKLKTIAILHTGGTVASKVDYETGAALPSFDPAEILEMFPELKDIANIRSRLVKNMWSQDMRFTHYNILAKEIEREVKNGVDGVIITHGTDCLHYTSAALSFILGDLPIPVLLVGSQRSSDRGSTDAPMNLINAAYFIANSGFAEVGVCMHDNSNDNYCAILPGTRVRKNHTSRRDAFKAIGVKPWALVDYRKKEIKVLRKGSMLKKEQNELKVMPIKENIKIALVKQHNNMFAEQFLFYKDYDGLVIESTGLGNLPTSEIDKLTHESGVILEVLKHILEKGVVIAIAPETIYGRIMLSVYSNQTPLVEMGMLGHQLDMTPETAFIKLAWCLSNFRKDIAKRKFGQNLRGEITSRSCYREEFMC